MALDFQQTDTAAPFGAIAACSGLDAGSATVAKLCQVGGTAGSTEATATHATSAGGTRRLIHFELEVPADTTWAAGDWTVRFNTTTSSAQLIWDSVFICRVDSGGTESATIASTNGLGIKLNTETAETTIAGSAQTPSAGDRVYIVVGVTNNQTMSNSVGVTPSAIISSPFEAASTPETDAPAGLAAGSGSAFAATVDAVSNTNAPAGLAAGSGSALAASVDAVSSTDAAAGLAAGSGSALAATVATAVDADAGLAAGAGSALAAAVPTTGTYFQTSTAAPEPFTGSASSVADLLADREAGAGDTNVDIGPIDALQSEHVHFYTDVGDPGVDGTSTGTFTVKVRITATGNMNVTVSLARMESDGNIAVATSPSSAQSADTLGTLTFTFVDPALGTWASGDRLRVRIIFGSLASAQTASMGIGTADDTIAVPWETPVEEATEAPAGLAAASGSALAATVTTEASTNAPAGLAAGAGSAPAASTTIEPAAGLAASTGSAFAATVATESFTNAPAGLAAGAGSAQAAAVTVGPAAGLAAGAGSALQATVTVEESTDAPAGLAAATGSGLQATVATESFTNAAADLAAGTGSAFAASTTVEPNAGLASATGSAPQPTVEIGAFTNAPAGLAAASGTAPPASIDITAPAGLAAATGDAQAVTAAFAILADAGLASATGSALGASIDIEATAAFAAGMGAAFGIATKPPVPPPPLTATGTDERTLAASGTHDERTLTATGANP